MSENIVLVIVALLLILLSPWILYILIHDAAMKGERT